MRCSKPMVLKKRTHMQPLTGLHDFPIVPCGQCFACRINAKKIWTSRLKLELSAHKFTAWVTLTYNEENRPENGCVSKAEIQTYLKGLRNAIANQKRHIRYFAVGEYGSGCTEPGEYSFGWRPHYHLLIYGMDGKDYHGWEQLLRSGRNIPDDATDDYALIHKAWKCKGFTTIGRVAKGGIEYIVGYIVKKLTRDGDKCLPYSIETRQQLSPEFSLKSQGLGRDTVDKIAYCFADDDEISWPVTNINLGRSPQPIGRYLRTRLNKKAGRMDALNESKSIYRIVEGIKHEDQVGGLLDLECFLEKEREADEIKAKQKCTLKYRRRYESGKAK